MTNMVYINIYQHTPMYGHFHGDHAGNVRIDSERLRVSQIQADSDMEINRNHQQECAQKKTARSEKR